ncbi:MAG: TerB family tellurite resistance protein [Alphaproteobacteria bacterium]
MNKTNVTESQFYMWRTLFAIAHADDIVTSEEVRYLSEALADIPFSEEQKTVLQQDISTPQDIEEMFDKIVDAKDQAAFFNFARQLVWVDGDYGEAEQKIMLKLKQSHIKNVDVDNLIGKVELSLETETIPRYDPAQGSRKPAKGGVRDVIFSFRDKFIKEKMGK